MLKRRSVIVGGGFAGTALAQRLERGLSEEWETVLISEENYTLYTPLLAEVVGASLLPSHATAPIRQLARGTRFLRARVTSVDSCSRVIGYRAVGESGDRQLGYDHLVYAFGMSSNLDMIPGMDAHALPLKTLGDALDLRNRIIERLEESELEGDAERRARNLSFVVVGGGSSGVEVAGAMADFLQVARRLYPHLEKNGYEVHVLEARDRLLYDLPESLGTTAAEKLREQGVDVRTGARVEQVYAGGVPLGDEVRIDAETVVCTVGMKPAPLVEHLAVDLDQGRIRTDADMSVPDAEGVWALGDCAAVPNARSGEISPPTAQFAVRQARRLANNLRRVIDEKKALPFGYRMRGAFATVGHHRAVGRVGPLRVSGFVAWLMWRAFYLSKVPTWARKLAVYLHRTVQIPFPADVSDLHFRRSNGRDTDS